MRKVTRTEFGALVGVNEGIIRRAIKSGRVLVDADGFIDADTQVTRWEDTRDHSRVHSGQADDGSRTVRGRKPTATGAEASREAEEKAEGGFKLKNEKTKLEIELLKEELAQARQDTIPRDDVRRALSGFARLQSSKWLNFSNRFGSQLAATLGCDPKLLMAELDRYVRDQLVEIANISSPVP